MVKSEIFEMSQVVILLEERKTRKRIDRMKKKDVISIENKLR